MIRIESLAKVFRDGRDRIAAVDNVSLTVGTGEMVTLLGPSGCGKTTTLRCVAGLERPDGGSITIDNDTVVDISARTVVPAHRRNLGMVFQSYAIWPHMTVAQNISYALEGKHLPKAEIRKRTADALAMVQLGSFGDRPAPRLSGGQQQRVAIARALVGRPRALLFDEPLSNLDAKLRADMRAEIRHLQQQTGLTSIYVTHDQSEALAISDWIIVMRKGRIVERGRPAEIYARPRSLFTAHFIGNTNLIPGRVTECSGGEVLLETALGPLAGIDPNGDLRPGDAVRLSIRPEDMHTSRHGQTGARNAVTGRIAMVTFQGAAIEAALDAGGQSIQCTFPRTAEVRPGDEVSLGFHTRDAVVLRDEPLDEPAPQA